MKIKSKRIIQCKEAVYDITVPDYHNFLLEQGIFVHNCDHPAEVIGGWCNANAESTVPGSKDSGDAVAQVTYSAFVTPIKTSIHDIATSIQQAHESSITTQVKPAYYNVGKRVMSDREAMKKALAMFGK